MSSPSKPNSETDDKNKAENLPTVEDPNESLERYRRQVSRALRTFRNGLPQSVERSNFSGTPRSRKPPRNSKLKAGRRTELNFAFDPETVSAEYSLQNKRLGRETSRRVKPLKRRVEILRDAGVQEAMRDVGDLIQENGQPKDAQVLVGIQDERGKQIVKLAEESGDPARNGVGGGADDGGEAEDVTDQSDTDSDASHLSSSVSKLSRLSQTYHNLSTREHTAQSGNASPAVTIGSKRSRVPDLFLSAHDFDHARLLTSTVSMARTAGSGEEPRGMGLGGASQGGQSEPSVMAVLAAQRGLI